MTPFPLPADADESLLAQAVRRRTGDRQAAAEDEVRRLLDVGLRLMQDSPASPPRIADIVSLAGVSNDAFYRAFRSKDDLMAAIADDGSRRLISYVRHQAEKAADPAGRVRAIVQAVLAQAADPKVAETTRAVLRHTAARKVPSVDVRERLAAELAGPLGALGSGDPERDALVAACAVFAVMEQHLWRKQTPTADDTEHLVTFLLSAAGSREGTASDGMT
jgi:AcrR family transcriptional regulator